MGSVRTQYRTCLYQCSLCSSIFSVMAVNGCNSQLLSYWCIPDTVQASKTKSPAQHSHFHKKLKNLNTVICKKSWKKNSENANDKNGSGDAYNLREIDFITKELLTVLWRAVGWIQICHSLNHRKKRWKQSAVDWFSKSCRKPGAFVQRINIKHCVEVFLWVKKRQTNLFIVFFARLAIINQTTWRSHKHTCPLHGCQVGHSPALVCTDIQLLKFFLPMRHFSQMSIADLIFKEFLTFQQTFFLIFSQSNVCRLLMFVCCCFSRSADSRISTDFLHSITNVPRSSGVRKNFPIFNDPSRKQIKVSSICRLMWIVCYELVLSV